MRRRGLRLVVLEVLVCALGLLLDHELPAEGREWTYFLIPAVGNSKNDGADVGLIAPIIFNDRDGRINKIIAPMYVHNEFLGSRMILNLFQYPRRGEEITLIGSVTEKIERKFLATYRNLYLSSGRYSVEAGAGFFKNATARFFGLGNQTPATNETNYTDRELYGYAVVGLYVGPARRVTWTERLRNVELQPGGIENLQFTQAVFPSVRGTGGGTIWGHKLAYLDDTRDDSVTPTIGSYFIISTEVAQAFTGSAGVFSRHGVEYRKLFPNQTKQYTFVVRGRLEATVGGADTPFFERSMLGGQNSLRGFGVGRFVDDHSLVLNVEERIQLFHLRVFGTIAEIETAPFLDVGKVMNTFAYRAFAQYEFNPGIGFRAIARPNVVGRVDIATSSDGKALFAGLDFPF